MQYIETLPNRSLKSTSLIESLYSRIFAKAWNHSDFDENAKMDYKWRCFQLRQWKFLNKDFKWRASNSWRSSCELTEFWNSEWVWIGRAECWGDFRSSESEIRMFRLFSSWESEARNQRFWFGSSREGSPVSTVDVIVYGAFIRSLYMDFVYAAKRTPRKCHEFQIAKLGSGGLNKKRLIVHPFLFQKTFFFLKFLLEGSSRISINRKVLANTHLEADRVNATSAECCRCYGSGSAMCSVLQSL